MPVKLAFIAQPSFEILEGSPIPPVQVAIQDQQGNVVTSSNEVIVISLGNNTANALLSGTRTVQAVNGIATFSDLFVDRVGAVFVLIAQSGTYSPAYSAAFNVISPNPVIYSALEALNTPITVGQAASFIIGVSDNHGVTFEWNWGDGSTTITTVPNTTHSYFTAGLFNVTVTITNELGRTLSQSLMVSVLTDGADEENSGAGVSPLDVKSLRILWNLQTSREDLAKLKVVLPVEEGFSGKNQKVHWNICGHTGSALLGSNSPANSQSKVALKIRASRRGSKTLVAHLQITLRGEFRKVMRLTNVESLDSNSMNKKGDLVFAEVSVGLVGYKAYGPSLIPGTFRGEMGVKSSFRK